ncbi:MAG: glutathione S-transferase family protein [Caulobacterales bacterium]
MSAPVLYIGNKNYSSWSMRPWLALHWARIGFEDHVMPLPGGGYGKSSVPEIRDASPSGRVPALHVDGVVIWDSLAICEWAAEQKPDSGLLPKDAAKRALCRSVASEMHSGFAAVRRELPMNIRRFNKPPLAPLSDDAKKDIARLEEIWGSIALKADGVIGTRTIADAFFTPVATRLRSYGIPLEGQAQAYCDALLSDATYLDWERSGKAEPWVVEAYESY